jgi:hypothetical protein
LVENDLKKIERNSFMMKLRIGLLAIACSAVIFAAGCRKATNPNAPGQPGNAPGFSKTPGPLPEKGFKAQITMPDGPLKLRAGQKETITVKVKNASDTVWWQRGGETNDRSDNKFYIAVGNRWLDKDGKRTSDTEGHNGIPKDLKPGDEVEVPLLITAPKEPGEYTIELDMVQEGVTWFADKGSPATKAKVTVVK